MNIGIVTGAISGIVVIDLDSREAWKWATTRPVHTLADTNREGLAPVLSPSGEPIRNRARIDTGAADVALDVRGDHVSSSALEVFTSRARPTCSLAIGPRASRSCRCSGAAGWLERPRRQNASSTALHLPRPTGDLIERARRYLAAIPKPEIGQGSDTAVLSAACRLVRGFAVAPADAEALLWEWAGGRPGWTRDWIAAKVYNAQRYGDEPIGALR